MKNKITMMENVVSVIGAILDEWHRGGEPITMEELEHLYDECSEILIMMESK